MKIKTFLVVNDRGGVRTVKNRPALDFNEVAIQVAIDLPDRLFQKPALSAEIVVPEDAVQSPEITAEVTDNIKEAIQTATGVQVRLTVINPDEE